MTRTTPVVICAAFIVASAVPTARAQSTWNQGVGGSWSTATNWTPNGVPNAIGAAVVFNNAASASNAAQTANRSIVLDGAKTVGSITFNADAANAFTNSIATGTGGPLTFDNGGAGVTLTTQGVGTGNHTISVATVFADNVTAVVNQTASTSGAGSLNLTTAISGAGGFTKQGDGLATFGTGAKTYTGPTLLSGGRMRISAAAAPATSSSFTVAAGAQLTPITTGTYTFGAGALNLSGNGATSGPFAAFPGTIRPESGVAVAITNAVVLQGNASAVSAGTPANSSITFQGVISGAFSFTAGSGGAGNTGTIALNGANTYTGGTVVEGGTLLVGLIGGGSSATASLGTGNVTVNGAAGASSLQLQAGVTNAIADTATLSLAGGGTAGTADVGFANLAAGVNEVGGGLTLAGVGQVDGTYGSTGSGAMFQNNEFFSGTGIITVVTPVPEPSSVLLACAAIGGVCRWRRSRRDVRTVGSPVASVG